MSLLRSRAAVIAACAAALIVLASPVARQTLEARLVTHMLVQMPLLALIGFGVARAISADPPRWLAAWNRAGTTGLLLALFVAMFWMLPRAMDAALVDARFEAGKFVSLPLAGSAVAWSYPQAGPIVKGVLNAHVVSAFGIMGWAYLAAPARLCNGYLASDQQAAGAGLLAAGLALSVHFAMRILRGPTRPRAPAGASVAARLCIDTK